MNLSFSDLLQEIGLRKGDTELLNALNNAYAKIKADGTFDKLQKKYFTTDISVK